MLPADQLVDNFIPSVQVTRNGIERSDYSGGAVDMFRGSRADLGMYRPFYDAHDRPCVVVNSSDSRGNPRFTVERGEKRLVREKRYLTDMIRHGQVSPVFNATSLRKEEWIELDRVVLKAARYPLRAWADLAAANSFGGFNGMGKMLLEHETMSDPGEAMQDMDGLSEGRTDSPKFQLEGLPLPITHSDFWYSERRLANSRNSGTPLDVTMGEAAGRRVAEMIEKQTIGNSTGITYGGNSTQVGGYGRTSSVYGYLNFTPRLTKTNMTSPAAGGWTPETTQKEVNTCLNTLRNGKFRGPFMMYHSNDWDPKLDGDYYVSTTSGAVAPTKTLRSRLREIDGIMDVRRLDFLFGTAPSTTLGPGFENLTSGGGGSGGAWPYTLIFVQMTGDVARAVNGLDITTVQWPSVGGMRLNFKVLCIQVPQLRADFYGNCGILVATTA